MKKWIVMGVGVAAIAALALVLLLAARQPQVKITVTNNGLQSAKVGGVEVLDSAAFEITQIVLRQPGGQTSFGETFGKDVIDVSKKELTRTLPWGQIKVSYAAEKNQLTFTVTTTNASDTDTIQGLWYQLARFKFPSKLKEYDGSTPLLADNMGQVAFVKASFDGGTIGIVTEDFEKPLIAGFPWALDRPKNMVFPLSVNTDRVKMYPDSYPTIHRPIPPRSSDQFKVSVRFGRPGSTDEVLAGDAYKRFGAMFPKQLNWTDRRPIGAIVLSTNMPEESTNPRRWFGDSHLNVTTPTGKAEFRQRLLAQADGSISIMHEMNAQGMIVWDLEGQQSPGTVSVSDPRAINEVAPEMAAAADEYFARFRAAGLRTGIRIRPEVPNPPAAGEIEQDSGAGPGQNLIDEIAYAKKRWGVSLIFIDSNVNATDPNPLDAAIIQKIAAAFPDCLLIPEHSNLRYYAYSMPYKELRQGVVSTPDLVRQVYPNASTLIYTADGPLDLYHDSLKAAVKSGDIMLYRTWFRDVQNEKVKALYNE